MSELALIPRSPLGWLTVESELCGLTVVTWAVAPERLTRHVPDGFSLELLEGKALISAVTFANRRFRPHWLPVGLSLGQTNYRVYVRREGQRGVLFVGTAIDTSAVFIPRRLWRMPWQKARYRFAPGSVTATGAWGMRLSYSVEGPVETLPGFASLAEGLTVLTQPWVGYYQGSNSRIGRYTIWHAPYRARCMAVNEARFDLLDALDIVPYDDQLAVHSALYEAQTTYHVHLPPRWID